MHAFVRSIAVVLVALCSCDPRATTPPPSVPATVAPARDEPKPEVTVTPRPVEAPPAPAPPLAAALAVEVAVEKCDKRYAVEGASLLYAEHPFQGRTALELSRVVVIGQFAFGHAPGAPPGYLRRVITELAYVRDGAVAVPCRADAAAVTMESVTFILSRGSAAEPLERRFDAQ